MIKHSVVNACLFTYHLTKELYRWEKTYPSIITLLMADYIDFQSCGKAVNAQETNLLLNLIETSKNSR